MRSGSDSASDAALRAARASLRSDLDGAYLGDLEALSVAELRVRVVRMAAEVEERARWEALRTKEFLSMKEKETSDK